MGWMWSDTLWVSQHLPPPQTIPGHPGDPAGAVFAHLLRGMGWCKKVCSDLVFLLISPTKVITGEMVFGLAIVWVHPYQVHIPTLDEVVKKLTLLTTTGKNWTYAFVQLNKDAQHVPLPKEGHLSTMIEGLPSRNTCGHLHQLEVHLLLQSENWVVYLKGFNRGLELVCCTGHLQPGIGEFHPKKAHTHGLGGSILS